MTSNGTGKVQKRELHVRGEEEMKVYLVESFKTVAESAPPLAKRACDVFLCHNSKEKETVLTIAKLLRTKGITPWIDSEKIVGGATYDEVIKQAIIESRSAAIFWGPQGWGRYQVYEIRAFLDACMSKKLRVIPVLLPGCDELPSSEIFLRQHHSVKFSRIDDQDAIGALVRAVRATH